MEIEKSDVKKEDESPIKSIRKFSLAILNQKPTTAETIDVVNKPTETINSNGQDKENKKRFKCEICGKDFKQSSSLSKHRRVHTGEKPYECEICNKAFNRSDNLRAHRLVHTGGKIRSFGCEICHKTFTNSSNLTRHKLVHTDQKPFECEMCKMRFNRSDLLKIHIRSKNH